MILADNYSGFLLFEIENGSIRFVRKLKGFDESSRIFEQASDGDIWMAHGSKGIYRLRLNSSLDSLEFKVYGTESGLPTTLLNSVRKLKNQRVFSTEYGLYRHNPDSDRLELDPTFKPYFEYDFTATSMAEDPLGNIFYLGEKEVRVLERQINGSYTKKNQIFNKIKPFLNDDLQNISLIRPNEVLFAAS